MLGSRLRISRLLETTGDPEHAVALADEASPYFMPGAFQLMTASLRDEPKIREAFRSGAGVGWHEHDHGVFFEGCERFFRPGYAANLVPSWIPALDGVEAKLQAGARVADVGCGVGASTVLMAQAYPASTFVGFDYHLESIEQARLRARDAGVADRVDFAVAAPPRRRSTSCSRRARDADCGDRPRDTADRRPPVKGI